MQRILRSARERGVPLFIATGLVVGATVVLTTDAPPLPTIAGITVVGTFFGWLRTGWKSRRRGRRRRGDAMSGPDAPPSARTLAFLATHGRDVIDGVIPGGLPPDLALAFIDMLEQEGVALHGLEVWRGEPDGYSMDLSSLWYSERRQREPYADAPASLRWAKPAPRDLVLIQFGPLAP